MQATKRLNSAGQSIWLDNITRDLLSTGTLERYIRERPSPGSLPIRRYSTMRSGTERLTMTACARVPVRYLSRGAVLRARSLTEDLRNPRLQKAPFSIYTGKSWRFFPNEPNSVNRWLFSHDQYEFRNASVWHRLAAHFRMMNVQTNGRNARLSLILAPKAAAVAPAAAPAAIAARRGPAEFSSHPSRARLELLSRWWARIVSAPCGSAGMKTTKSVSLPVSMLGSSSVTISDEPGNTTSEMRSMDLSVSVNLLSAASAAAVSARGRGRAGRWPSPASPGRSARC